MTNSGLAKKPKGMKKSIAFRYHYAIKQNNIHYRYNSLAITKIPTMAACIPHSAVWIENGFRRGFTEQRYDYLCNINWLLEPVSKNSCGMRVYLLLIILTWLPPTSYNPEEVTLYGKESEHHDLWPRKKPALSWKKKDGVIKSAALNDMQNMFTPYVVRITGK